MPYTGHNMHIFLNTITILYTPLHYSEVAVYITRDTTLNKFN